MWVLDIPENPNLRGLVKNMFNNWNYKNKCFIFQGLKLKFIKIDVMLILSLPNHEDPVPMDEDAASNQFFLQHFKDSNCTKKELEKLIRSSKSQQIPRANKLY